MPDRDRWGSGSLQTSSGLGGGRIPVASCLVRPVDAQHRTAEQELARLAGAAHGVVTRSQLLAAGLTSEQIASRLRRGVLLREHRGVYRVGHRAPSPEARYLAAVLACGPGAMLCGAPAGRLWGVVKGDWPAPEVVAPTERRVAGVVTRRSRRAARAGTTLRGIPVTTVAQTLVDLAARLTEDELALACHEAGVRYGTTPRQVERLLTRRSRRPGAAKLRSVLHGDTPVSLSGLERRFLALLREAGLPRPQTNRPAGTKRVDCRWPEHRLTVELDSYRYHRSRHAWEQDRRREREAYARGDDLRRYTHGDVFKRTGLVLAELRGLLPRSRPA